MFATRSLSLLVPALSALFSSVMAAPTPYSHASLQARQASTSDNGFWVGSIARQDTVWNNPESNYTVFRNVMDYGAKGDGQTDDTAAINAAIADGNRCGAGCNSSTLTPAIVYFPIGKYVVSAPIQMYYFTQMIGEIQAGNNVPIIAPSASYTGAIGVFDADPYYPNSGENWYINQNNFFRQVRNFNFDLTGAPDGIAAIHWQVAQATSLQNIVFNMKDASGQQIGVNMDNGSGGFFGNLTFNGGLYGAKLGNQQFTTRDLTFNGCGTAIYIAWSWGWTLNDVNIQNCNVGLDISASPSNLTVGSVVLSDSVISNTPYGIRTAWNATGNVPARGNTLILDNVDMKTNVGTPIVDVNNQTVSSDTMYTSWVQGSIYDHAPTMDFARQNTAPLKASSLTDAATGHIFSRIRPQYEDVPVSQFASAKSHGARGDGATDDTAAVQSFLNYAASNNKIAYFDHGAYLVSDTIHVPNNVKITGSCWPLIVAKGSAFSDVNSPKPVFSVGDSQKASDNGVEISDLIFETLGPAPGAIMIEWNLQSSQGASGMWDTHVRIGGAQGTELQTEQCRGDATTPAAPSPDCYGVFLMFHATPQSTGVYLENTWFWVADHDMDNQAQTQTSIYSGRGVLIQSTEGPVWLWGTASEHSLFYNYQIDEAKAVFGGFMQSETPYYQPRPAAPAPFTPVAAYNDPTFECTSTDPSVPCANSWGLRVLNSSEILVYSTGMYSFFNDYSQDCVASNDCQEYMIEIQNSQVDMYAVTTKSAVRMIVDSAFAETPILDADNRATFGATVGLYSTGSSTSGVGSSAGSGRGSGSSSGSGNGSGIGSGTGSRVSSSSAGSGNTLTPTPAPTPMDTNGGCP